MDVIGQQQGALMRGSDDIAKDPVKLQKFLDMVAAMSSPVPYLGVGMGLGADVFRAKHSGMGKVSAAASALPVGMMIGRALAGGPVGTIGTAIARNYPPIGMSTVQANADDIARATRVLEKTEGRLSNIKQAADEAEVLGALSQSAPKAAKLFTEYMAIPEVDHIARASKLKEVTGALFQGVKPGFRPTGGAIASMFGHNPINKLVHP